jgi:2-oxoglutarate dehydrogenase E2 component (dihydrolipoamide succinyltransferase)
MKHNIAAPNVGESITEVSILKWAKENGQQVKTGDLLLEIESDKATVEIVAEYNGSLTILKPAGERIPVGEIIGSIDDSVQGTAGATKTASAPAQAQASKVSSAASATPSTGATPGPAARKALAESGLSAQQIQASGPDGRITKGDVIAAGSAGNASPSARASATPVTAAPSALRPGDRRVAMSNLRARIAERLVQAQHTAAILTTFNEADMSAVVKLRGQHKDAFKAKHGVSLGFMSFFTRACAEALKLIPEVNASVEGRDVIYHDYIDMGIAVGSERGLVVPVVREAQNMGFVEIEKKIAELAIKARDSKLSIADMTGGTFTISNGGVYGSLLSTPILNPPQSAILGMHKIQDRPIAVEGKIEIRPMMYLALSYDHRLIDGKGAVTFLIHVKDFIEHPEKLNLQY